MKHKSIFIVTAMVLFFALGAASMMVFLKIEKSGKGIIERVIKEPLKLYEAQKAPQKADVKTPAQDSEETSTEQKERERVEQMVTKLPEQDKETKKETNVHKKQDLESSLDQILTLPPQKELKEKKKQIEQKEVRVIPPEQIRRLYEKRMEALRYLE